MTKLVESARMVFKLGLAGIAVAWIVIFVAAMLNPWFVFTRNAFSDLGAPGATAPWFFNDGMMLTGTLICIYSWSLVVFSGNRTETTGSVFFLVAGFFLIMIGFFHEGTYPHLFVSYWFFVQSLLAILAWGAGLVFDRRKRTGLVLLLLGAVSTIVAVLVPWPSTAAIEAFGIVVIDIWTIVMAVELDFGRKLGQGGREFN